MIIGTSWTFQAVLSEIAAEVLQQGGTTKFAVLTGWQPAPNLVVANTKMWQAKYLIGYLAGLMTKTGKMCYVASIKTDDGGVASGVVASAIGFRDGV